MNHMITLESHEFCSFTYIIPPIHLSWVLRIKCEGSEYQIHKLESQEI